MGKQKLEKAEKVKNAKTNGDIMLFKTQLKTLSFMKGLTLRLFNALLLRICRSWWKMPPPRQVNFFLQLHLEP